MPSMGIIQAFRQQQVELNLTGCSAEFDLAPGRHCFGGGLGCVVCVQFLFGREGVRQVTGCWQQAVFSLTDVCWAERCSGWSCLLPNGGVSQIGRICRSFVCTVGQGVILSLEAAVGTPLGQGFYQGLIFSLLFLIKALRSRPLSAHGAYEPFCPGLCASLLAPCAERSSFCRGWTLLVSPLHRQAGHSAVQGGGFCGLLRKNYLYSAILYLCSWERRRGHEEELGLSDHPQTFLFFSW